MLIRRRAGRRGFTLVELLAVVTIVGILASMALLLLNGHVKASRTAEALSMVQSIRAAEESFRAENRRYLSVVDKLDSFGQYYPSKPDGKQRAFYQGGSDALDLKWKILHPTVAGPVRFGYAVVAGVAGENIPSPTVRDAPAFAELATAPFYVIQAIGDLNADGKFCTVAATSFSSVTYVEDEGE